VTDRDLILVSDEVRTAPGRVVDGRMLVAPGRLEALTGWALKPQGLCRDERCVPVRQRAMLDGPDGTLDVAAVGAALRHPVATEPGAAAVAWGAPDDQPGGAGRGELAPDLELPTLDGGALALSSVRGRKRLLVAFASW